MIAPLRTGAFHSRYDLVVAGRERDLATCYPTMRVTSVSGFRFDVRKRLRQTIFVRTDDSGRSRASKPRTHFTETSMTTTYTEVRHSIADAPEEASSAPTTLEAQPSKKALW